MLVAAPHGSRLTGGAVAVLVTMGLASGLASRESGRAQSVEGTLQIVEVSSRVFGNTRSLRVWLPDDYFEPGPPDRRYPVLYLNDGQNLFDARAATFGAAEWRVDETMSALVNGGAIPPIVVVGIDHAGRRARAREYLPYPDDSLEPPEPSPRGGRYGAFLATEVFPLVEDRYRVARHREGRVLGGSSYGALVALHVAVTRPELVGGLLLESPSLYVDDGHILRDVAAAPGRPDRVYLGIGTNELALPGCPDHPGNLDAVHDVDRLADLLRRDGLQDGETLFITVEPCAEHRETAWARRFPHAVRVLFGAP